MRSRMEIMFGDRLTSRDVVRSTDLSSVVRDELKRQMMSQLQKMAESGQISVANAIKLEKSILSK